MNIQFLKDTAKAMLAPGKGVLAIDESHSTCAKRFEALGLECTEETRRAYRGLLVSAPGIEEAVSGYIMFDETLRQANDQSVPFTKILADKGILAGIKVDTGAKALALHEGESVTEGLDGLRERLAEYSKLGASFAKWRAVITIGENMPSQACLMANAHALARYAGLCQEANIVPMVEPEILIDGNHSIEKAYEVSVRAWKILFEQLQEQGVILEGLVLKTSMIISGTSAQNKADRQTVAEMTLKGLKEAVPANTAGVVFLSGGQSPEDSTVHLDLISKIGGAPWPISFSYGRGIQEPALKLWAQNTANIESAQKVLLHRAKMNGLASLGKYNHDLDV